MRQFLKAAWQRWKIIAEKVGHVQAKLIFSFLYFVLVAPFAVALKVMADPLHLKMTAPLWRDASRQTLSLEDARKQF
jgi:hypothetical protein